MPKKEKDKVSKLKDMVDAIIDNRPEDAETAFHSYIVDKTKNLVQGEQPEEAADEKDEKPEEAAEENDEKDEKPEKEAEAGDEK